jgi:uncharacterized protein (DUF2237 family)
MNEKHIASEHIMSIERMEFSMVKGFFRNLGTCTKGAEDIGGKSRQMRHE